MDIQKYLDLFEGKYRNEEKKEDYFYSFKLDAIKIKSPEYNKMSDLINSSDLDENSAYRFTVEALEAIKEILEGNEEKEWVDELDDSEIVEGYSEAPVYTSELLEWVSKETNYTFVEDAIDEYGGKNQDGNTDLIQSIQIGYSEAWKQHYFKVLEAVRS